MTDEKRKKFISNSIYIGLFMTALAIYALTQAVNFKGVSRYFPTIVMSIFLVFSVWMLAIGVFETIAVRRGKSDKGNPEMKATPFILFASMCVYVFCVQKIGFFVSSAIYMPVAMMLYGQRDFKKMILVTIGVLLFLYWMFIVQMQLHMPKALLF